MDMSKKFVVLYSHQQDAFHVETVGEMLEENRKQLLGGSSNGYVVLAFADTAREGYAKGKEFRRILDEGLD